MDACRKGAITLDREQKAHIDKTKCVECGLCSKACPYSAIINTKRPCENSCKVKAISMSEDKYARINDEKCIACGACVYQCPFGAISDKSYIIDVIDTILKSDNNTKYKVYALVAPAVASQFKFAKPGQIITGIKMLGFANVYETALGADLVANKEAPELAEKGFLTSSCCPAFVKYVQTQFPQLAQHISSNLSPMGTIAKYIKEKDPECKIIFIGPCTAKKAEFQKDEVRPYVDCVITFEELLALIDSRNIDLTALEETALDHASYFGRIFARSGGLADAVRQGLKEHGLEDFDYKPVVCDGIEQCKIALLKAAKNMADANFIEGMACVGGCVGGAGCLKHGEKNRADIDKYGTDAGDRTIADSIAALDSSDDF